MFPRGKFSYSDLWVTSHDKTSDFYCCAWQRGASPWPLLAVRALLAGGALAVLAGSLAAGRSGASPYWLLYLTNWGLVLVAAAACSALLVSWMAAYTRPAEDAATPWYVALYWVLFNMTQSSALAITILYWVLLYDPEVVQYASGGERALDVATHALNSALTLAELLAARTPVRLAHAPMPLLLAALYLAFSALYYAAGGVDMSGSPYIYPVLDWRRARAAGALGGGALAGVLALHAALAVLARARTALARRCVCAPRARTPRP